MYITDTTFNKLVIRTLGFPQLAPMSLEKTHGHGRTGLSRR